MWRKEITKEEVNELELRAWEGDIILIEDDFDIPMAINEILKEKVIGIDTETKPTFKKGKLNQVALLQIATSNRVFLIRLNKTGFHPDIAKIFENKRIKKIGIAVKNDINEIRQFLEFTPESVIDLNEYCTKLGFKNIGVKKLSAMILGCRISKRQQTSNWEAETLSPPQLRYAATDAWVCREIYLELLKNRN